MVFWIAGLEWRYMLRIAAIGVLLVAVAIASKGYRLGRVISYVDPDYSKLELVDTHGWVKSYIQRSTSVRDAGYQPRQSKIAVGTGGIFGVGLMQGKQKLMFLPDAHTDFIFATVGEELGLWGSTAVILGFLVILWRGARLFLFARDDFGKYLALGVTLSIVVQAFINMSVVLDMAPTKGFPLPMISFGGSSLLSTLLSLGMLLSVSEHEGNLAFTFVMAGGGSGGHVLPALAVARELRARGHRAIFVGIAARYGSEARTRGRISPRVDRDRRVETGRLAPNRGDARGIAGSVWQAARILDRAQPHAIFSMGGYVAGPVLLAALWKRIPVVMMEPNAVPGFTHRHLARFAARALVSFHGDGPLVPAGRTEVTACPSAKNFSRCPRSRPPR